MLQSQSRVRAVLGLVAWSLVGCVSVAWAGGNPITLTRQERSDLWSRNIDLLDMGRSSGGDKFANELASDDLYRDPRAAHWISEYRDSFTLLEEARLKDYNKYVEQAKEHFKEDRVREAIILANRALANATDRQALLKSDWVMQLTRAASKKADKYRHERKWRKAYSIYYDLALLFEEDKEFKKLGKECRTHARLDVIYEEDEIELLNNTAVDIEVRTPAWKERLEGVLTTNVEAALDRIDRFYVEEADFREIATSGLEHLLLLCESEVMRETFDGLGKEELRKDFEVRIQSRLKRIERSSRVTAKHTKEHFRRALKINKDTVQLPERLISYEFTVGALASLDDFTSMIWPIEFREFDKHTRGDFVGVGISITGGGTSERPVTVVSPLEDTPAYRAGIRAKDEITHVNGQTLKHISLTKTVKMITGLIGTDVTLTIRRPSEHRSFDVTLTRALVKIISVKGIDRDPQDPQRWECMLDKDMGVAYVRVGSFQENTVGQLRGKIDEVLERGARGLILDLRFNPGGLLKSAVEMAQLFLSRDDHPIVSTEGLRDERWSNPKARHDGPFTNLPLIVLVNQGSASASEIVSGALKDHNRAIILGDRTFGKFSVQKLIRLGGSETHLKLTTARYYLPSGQSLHKEEGATEWGVMPDVSIKRVPKELIKVDQMWRDRDVLAKAGVQTDAADDESEAKPRDEKESNKSDDEAADSESRAAQEEHEVLAEAERHGQLPESDEPAEIENSDDEDEEEDEDEEDEDRLLLEPDPNELPDVDIQLDAALVLMRLHLLGESTLRLAAIEQAEKSKPEVRNP